MYTFLVFLNETEDKRWSRKRLVEVRLKDLQDRKFWFEEKVVHFLEWLKEYRPAEKTVTAKRRHHRSGKVHSVVCRYKGGNKLSDKTRKNYVDAVRSFFAFHRLNLQFTTQQRRIISKRPRAVYSDYLFDLEEIAAMAEVGNPQERYILLVGKDIGLRAVDFASLTQGLFAKVLTKEAPVFLGKIYTQKEGVYAFPFLSDDGVEAARVWLQVLKSKGQHDDNSLMLNIKSKELTPNLKRLATKSGINPHGQRIRFHCLRKFLTDRISLKMSESKWKQIVGKGIAEEAYISSLKLREAYRHVMPHIQISAIKESRFTPEEIRELKRLLQMSRKREIDVKAKRS